MTMNHCRQPCRPRSNRQASSYMSRSLLLVNRFNAVRELPRSSKSASVARSCQKWVGEAGSGTTGIALGLAEGLEVQANGGSGTHTRCSARGGRASGSLSRQSFPLRPFTVLMFPLQVRIRDMPRPRQDCYDTSLLEVRKRALRVSDTIESGGIRPSADRLARSDFEANGDRCEKAFVVFEVRVRMLHLAGF